MRFDAADDYDDYDDEINYEIMWYNVINYLFFIFSFIYLDNKFISYWLH